MKDQGNGRIINISSVGGHTALRTGVVYGSTKAALIHMTKVLAMEWAQYGIQVNSVGPWYFRTPLTEKPLNDEAYMQAILTGHRLSAWEVWKKWWDLSFSWRRRSPIT